MKKPIVGVMPLWDDDKESIWILPGYMDGLRDAGAVPILFPLTDIEEDLTELTDMCDGFLFTGGHDVSVEIYHEKPLENMVFSCALRDRMEMIVLKKAMESDKPVLGICRGIQFINAALGGTLYQDLKTQYNSSVEHHQNPPYDVPVHQVDIIENTPLYECLGKKKKAVNSYHHQAVRKLADSLKVMAVSEDGLTEAVYKPDQKFLWAVQWHPEYIYQKDDDQRKIFRSFVQAMML